MAWNFIYYLRISGRGVFRIFLKVLNFFLDERKKLFKNPSKLKKILIRGGFDPKKPFLNMHLISGVAEIFVEE